MPARLDFECRGHSIDRPGSQRIAEARAAGDQVIKDDDALLTLRFRTRIPAAWQRRSDRWSDMSIEVRLEAVSAADNRSQRFVKAAFEAEIRRRSSARRAVI